MTKIEEKIELLNKAGFDGIARNLRYKQQAQQTIKDMTDLKFVPASKAEIDKKITSWYFGSDWNCPWLLFCVVGLLPLILLGKPNLTLANKTFILLVTVSLDVIGLFLHFFSKTRTAMRALEDWKDDLPYGACLAIAEAKKAGMDSFRIYYPVTKDRFVAERVKADPVITAHKNNVEFEVFAWDDSKVYE